MTSVDACTQAQVDMWMAERLGGLGASYHLAFGFAISGPLDVDLLARACRALLRRHPILLTCFPDHDGAPRPAPVPEHAWRLEVVPDPVDPAAVVRARTGEPFDLARGPLVRTSLVTTGPAEQLLLFVCHHLVFDGTSRDIVARDLAALYQAEVTGGAAALPALPSPADYLERERAQVARPTADLPTGWRAAAALANDPARLSDAMPCSGGPPAAAPPRAAEVVDFALPGDVRAGIGAVAAAARVTPFAALLASFTVLLDKYCRASGTAVPVTAVPADTRPAGFADSVGPYVNELPFRSPPPVGGSFQDHLAATGDRLRALLALRRVPLGELRRRGGDRWAAPSDRPGPAVVFGYRRAAPLHLSMADLAVAYQRSLPTHATRAEVEVQLTDDGEQVTGRLTVDGTRVDAGFAGELLAQWRRLLTQVLASPRRPLAEACLLSEQQRRSVLTDWNDTRVGRAAGTLAARFEAQVAATPEAVALVVDGQPAATTVSYAELNRRANRLAHRLRRLGAGPETLVAVCAERSAELVVGLLGTLKAGAAYLPLDPEYPPDRLRFMLRDSGAPALLTQRRLRGLLDPPPPAVLLLDDPSECADQPDTDPPPRATPASPAYAIYTSGSTGTPKAALLPHAAVDNRLAWMQEHYQLTADDRVLQKTPVGFDVSGWELFWPLLTGARMVLARPGGHRDGGYLVDLVNQQAVTTVHFVPPMLEAFLEQPDVATCRSLRRVICSGEELPARLVDRFTGCLDAELHNLYGPTEAAIDVTSWHCRPPVGDRVPIGKPIANTRLHILDRDLQPVPVGVAGELYIGGIGLARGYLGRPALTAERFLPDPVGRDGGRLYRTGDLACYRPDGAIVFLGRLDHQVKIRGHRVEPAEVEAALAAQPGVGAAAVLAREHPDRGPGQRRLVGYVVAAPPGPTPDPEALIKALRDSLPDYLVPAAVVLLDALPLTPNGKLDRRALPDPPPAGPDYTAPRSASERMVAEVWSDLFGLSRIGVDDDFFALGGHSLLATRTVARLRAAAGVELPMRTVFDHPTVGALAAAVEQASRR